jgi:hypothetical protein
LLEGAPPNKGNQEESREIKGNQEESREIKRSQGKSGEIKRSQGKPRKQRKPLQSTKEIPSNQWEYLQSIGFLSKQG